MATQTPALPDVRPRTAASHLLRIATPGQAERVTPIDRDSVSIGGGPQCTLRVSFPGVRPLHCLITRGPQGLRVRRWANETTLNGQPFSDSPLNDGDELTLGVTTVRLESVAERDAPSADQAPAAPADPLEATLAELDQLEAHAAAADAEPDAVPYAEPDAEPIATPDPWSAPKVAADPADGAPSTNGPAIEVRTPVRISTPLMPPVPAKLLKPWLDRPSDADSLTGTPAPPAASEAPDQSDVWSVALQQAADSKVADGVGASAEAAKDFQSLAGDVPTPPGLDELGASETRTPAGEPRVAVLRRRVHALIATLRRDRVQLADQRSTLDQAIAERDALRDELAALTAQAAELRLDRERLEADSADDRQRLAELAEELAAAAATIEALGQHQNALAPAETKAETEEDVEVAAAVVPESPQAPYTWTTADPCNGETESAGPPVANVPQPVPQPAPQPVADEWWGPVSLPSEDIVARSEGDAPAPESPPSQTPTDSPWEDSDAEAVTPQPAPEEPNSPLAAEPEPPAAAEDPFAPSAARSGHEPESFISRYAHLFADDAGAPPAAESATPMAPAHAEPFSAPAAEEDGSIDDYMSQLLRRSRGDNEGSAVISAATPEPVAAPPAAPSVPFTSIDQLQRSAQPERHTDMGMLRELANQSARQAIDVASLKQNKAQRTTNLAICAIVAAVGGTAAFFAPELMSVQLIGGLTLMAVAAGWCLASAHGPKPKARLPKPRQQADLA